MPRNLPILAVCFAVFVAHSLGLNGGMVLHVDDHGHLALTAPRVDHAQAHAHSHGDEADHGPHDYDPDADHGDLHDLIASCSDVPVGTQKADRAASDFAASHGFPSGFDACVLPLGTGLRPLVWGGGIGESACRGSTAHLALTCLRSVVLVI